MFSFYFFTLSFTSTFKYFYVLKLKKVLFTFLLFYF